VTETIAIIPARGGSKGLPGKNLALVGGRSLVARAVDVANEVGIPAIVSSDDERILEEAGSVGAVAELRPDPLADDAAATLDVIRFVLGGHPTAGRVVVLQPTSPLRIADDVRRCLIALEDAPAAATVSLVAHPIEWTFRRGSDDRLEPVFGWAHFASTRQQLGPAYQLNGAVFAATSAHIRSGGGFIEPTSAMVEMPVERSVDIDSAYDLELARALAPVSDR